MIKASVVVAIILVCLYALHRFLLYSESRGWIYYCKKQSSPGTAANAFLELHSMLEPQKKHMLTIQKEERKEEDGEGDPPEIVLRNTRAGGNSRT